jgi:uncharacterized membrane protein (UPF0127 family)
MPRSRWAVLAPLLLLLVACTGASDGSGQNGQNGQQGENGAQSAEHAPDLPRVVFQKADGTTAALWVEIADTDEERQCGLMHRLAMPADQAMLFVFPQDVDGPFWNRNTFIPLTLAWIAADGTVLDLTDMANVRPEDDPQPVQLYGPRPGTPPYRYVIEANQGWFARHGVQPGDRADLSEALARPPEDGNPICRQKGY